jgi:hypothetical protein
MNTSALTRLAQNHTGIVLVYCNLPFTRLEDPPPPSPLGTVHLLRAVLIRSSRAQLVSQLLSDIIVTSTISYKLIRSRTGWTATDRLVRKLLVLLVETQLPPTVWYVSTVSTCPETPDVRQSHDQWHEPWQT